MRPEGHVIWQIIWTYNFLSTCSAYEINIPSAVHCFHVKQLLVP